MASLQNLARTIAAAGVCAAVSSCALPPEQAWRKIKTDGLISYIGYEWKTPRGSESTVTPKPRVTPTAPSTKPTTGETPVLVLNQTTPGSTAVTTPAKPQNQSLQTLTAHSVPSLPGYVRSPYTNPPRLVDVQGAVPGSTMICPYTRRPFIVPSNAGGSSNSQLATNKPAPVKTESAPLNKPSTSASSSTVSNNTKPTTPPSTPSGNNKPSTPDKPAANTASNTTSTTPNLAPKPVQEIPYGDAIAGRPGFVNSPYAAKHQLVDVTGLPVGMEVKCPYTGKLFRVPSQDVATSKPAEKPPLSSPEQPAQKQ